MKSINTTSPKLCCYPRPLKLNKMPRFILLENVKGFESSSARNALIKTLQDCRYNFQELMISPTCLGIPNSRLRYFLIAKASPDSFSFQKTAKILEGFPKSESSSDTDSPMIPDSHCSTVNADKREDGTIIYKMETAQELERKRSQDGEQTVRRLRDFLEDEEQGTDMDSYLLPPAIKDQQIF
ncbi:tRNA (cytosine(38)-C(5))-methyltransferase-like [Neoarius graeffei]|uniref:tRNA (cytosine(38)-C(5))-methyltransferase-like n=1 Tax=Neoarius graeffei TaxID=443677 RepID=UPI00298C5186|nr:tRNA (cytosine(38)-C(5))-methyltransferase-like [Neoarius graeffei]